MFLWLVGCSSDHESADDDQAADDQTQDDDDDDDDSDSDDAPTSDAGTKKDAASDAGKATDSGSSDTGNKDSGATSNDGGSNPADAGSTDSGSGSQTDAGSTTTEPFSFFVTSLKAMRQVSGNQNGFGGDLRFGETGTGAGLRGADKICSTIAEMSMPGAGSKVWRAFLSAVSAGEGGGAVHAADRIGEGPWYDREGRLVGMSKTDLLQVRPAMANAAIKNDLPNEDGVPNHDPDGTGQVDNHDMLTGSGATGQLYRDDPKVTCNDWTKSEGDANDAPRVGHSWPRGTGGRGGGGGVGGMDNWMSALDEAGCAPGVSLIEMGPPMDSNPTVGSGGGYGGIYCFALSP